MYLCQNFQSDLPATHCFVAFFFVKSAFGGAFSFIFPLGFALENSFSYAPIVNISVLCVTKKVIKCITTAHIALYTKLKNHTAPQK